MHSNFALTPAVIFCHGYLSQTSCLTTIDLRRSRAFSSCLKRQVESLSWSVAQMVGGRSVQTSNASLSTWISVNLTSIIMVNALKASLVRCPLADRCLIFQIVRALPAASFLEAVISLVLVVGGNILLLKGINQHTGRVSLLGALHCYSTPWPEWCCLRRPGITWSTDIPLREGYSPFSIISANMRAVYSEIEFVE